MARPASGESATRRGLLRGAAGALALGAGGCGFRPLYGTGAAAGGDAEIARELAATRVPVIPERFGQLVRRSVQTRLGTSSGAAESARWELLVAPSVTGEPVGILRDGTATRVRLIATANWTLVRLAPREAIANGFERIIEAFNLPPNQPFAGELSSDATTRRIADQIANDVVTRVAVAFGNLRDGTLPQRIAPVTPPPALPDPTPSSPLGVPGLGGGFDGGAVPGGGLGGGIGPTDPLR